MHICKSAFCLPFSVPPDVVSYADPSGPIVEGSVVQLVCVATTGDLPITYAWHGPDGQAVSSPSNTSGNISLTFSTAGDYVCSATNEFGLDQNTTNIIRAGRTTAKWMNML